MAWQQDGQKPPGLQTVGCIELKRPDWSNLKVKSRMAQAKFGQLETTTTISLYSDMLLCASDI